MTEQEEVDDELEKVPVHELSRLRFGCPHCGSYMKVRSSKAHLPTYTELYMHCSKEFECGFRCKSALGVIETLAPSYQPNPNVHIKFGAFLKRQIRLEEQGQMRLGLETQPKKELQNERHIH